MDPVSTISAFLLLALSQMELALIPPYAQSLILSQRRLMVQAQVTMHFLTLS